MKTEIQNHNTGRLGLQMILKLYIYIHIYKGFNPAVSYESLFNSAMQLQLQIAWEDAPMHKEQTGFLIHKKGVLFA